MPGPKVAADFDALIQADRQRKKNEALANEIFGKSKSNKGGPRSATKPSTRPLDLASRITKRSSSTASTRASRNSPFTPPPRPSSTNPQNARSSRLTSALESTQANIVPSQRRSKGPGLSIRGKAGPFVVEARNFAPGTTAADIESALQNEVLDENGASGLLTCRLVATSPEVIAELVIAEKQIADRIISIYNLQRADGRVLRVSLKRSGLGSTSALQSNRASSSSAAPEATVSETPVNPFDEPPMEDVDMDAEGAATYEDGDVRSREPRKAEPDVQDGRYGFEDPQTSNPSHEDHGDRRRDDDGHRDRDRDRDRDHDHDRDRERDRDRDRYDRRDDRATGSYRRDDRPSNYNARASHYGNGVGGGLNRGMYGGGGGPGSFPRGGRGGNWMYSDDMMRGGRRGGGPSGPGGFVPHGGYRRGGGGPGGY